LDYEDTGMIVSLPEDMLTPRIPFSRAKTEDPRLLLQGQVAEQTVMRPENSVVFQEE
jgi:hypothetical protein